MTLAEYREKVLKSVKEARDGLAAKGVIKEAQRVLDSSEIGKHSQREFWVELYRLLEAESERQYNFSKRAAEKGPRYLAEAQSAEALGEIIAAAKAAVGQQVGG
jgi:hypothetical protein